MTQPCFNRTNTTAPAARFDRRTTLKLNATAFWAGLALVTLSATSAVAAPTVISYSGHMTVAGEAYDGNTTVRAALFAVADPDFTTDSPVWPQGTADFDFGSVPVEGGVFTITLGDDPTEPLDSDLVGGFPDGLWLALWVDGTALSPLQQVVSVPYALNAGDATSLGGFSADNYLTSAQMSLVAVSGDYNDLLNAPVVTAADQNCNPGDVVTGVGADGSLVCAAAPGAGQACTTPGQVVTGIGADGTLQCAAVATADQTCNPGDAVIAINADGTLQCGAVGSASDFIANDVNLQTGASFNVENSGEVGTNMTVGGAAFLSPGDSPDNGLMFSFGVIGGGGDSAFLRYIEGGDPDATRLRLGVGDDANDEVALYQQGQDRLTIAGGRTTVAGPTGSAGTSPFYQENFDGTLAWTTGGTTDGTFSWRLNSEVPGQSGAQYLAFGDVTTDGYATPTGIIDAWALSPIINVPVRSVVSAWVQIEMEEVGSTSYDRPFLEVIDGADGTTVLASREFNTDFAGWTQVNVAIPTTGDIQIRVRIANTDDIDNTGFGFRVDTVSVQPAVSGAFTVDASGADTNSGIVAAFSANGVARVTIRGDGAVHSAKTAGTYGSGGAAFQAGGADFAEWVTPTGSVADYGPGDVLMFGPDGRMVKAEGAYTHKVSGVISTFATIVGNSDPGGSNSGRVMMGVTGIVPTKVTLENGPIAPGDLVVVSTTAGHAMRGDRATIAQTPGCVIGKAYQAFDGAGGRTGVIKVLVGVR